MYTGSREIVNHLKAKGLPRRSCVAWGTLYISCFVYLTGVKVGRDNRKFSGPTVSSSIFEESTLGRPSIVNISGERGDVGRKNSLYGTIFPLPTSKAMEANRKSEMSGSGPRAHSGKKILFNDSGSWYMKHRTKMAGGEIMRRTCLAALLVSVLFLAMASGGYAQSAEDMIKNQSPGVRYAYRGDINGAPGVEAAYVRGDQITFVVEEGRSKGFSHTFRPTNKRTEGNRVILEDKLREYSIDSYRLVERDKTGTWTSVNVYMRE